MMVVADISLPIIRDLIIIRTPSRRQRKVLKRWSRLKLIKQTLLAESSAYAKKGADLGTENILPPHGIIPTVRCEVLCINKHIGRISLGSFQGNRSLSVDVKQDLSKEWVTEKYIQKTPNKRKINFQSLL